LDYDADSKLCNCNEAGLDIWLFFMFVFSEFVRLILIFKQISVKYKTTDKLGGWAVWVMLKCRDRDRSNCLSSPEDKVSGSECEEPGFLLLASSEKSDKKIAQKIENLAFPLFEEFDKRD